MIRAELSRSYQELNEETEQPQEDIEILEEEDDQDDLTSTTVPELDRNSPPVRFSRTCLKNFFSVLLIFVYLLLMGVAVFLVYQTITDFREKLKHPVMSVSYKEVDVYEAPGIALYPGKAELLSCEHHLYDHIPPLKNPGQPAENNCRTQKIDYIDPFTNQTMKHALIVKGPREVRKRELVFLQFHLNETEQDFSAIDYLLFSSFENFLTRSVTQKVLPPKTASQLVSLEEDGITLEDVCRFPSPCLYLHNLTGNTIFPCLLIKPPSPSQWALCARANQTKFMQDCESSFSSWKFSGGFRTWVKMSLVKTTEEDGSQSVEFRQETSVVNFIDRRSAADKGDQLFFVVFEWKDPYIQEIQDIITANPWSMIALLCGVFLVLFKAADFAKLSVKWMIKIRKRHLKKRARELNHIS